MSNIISFCRFTKKRDFKSDYVYMPCKTECNLMDEDMHRISNSSNCAEAMGLKRLSCTVHFCTFYFESGVEKIEMLKRFF